MTDGDTGFDFGDEVDDENDGASGTDSKNFADLRKYARKMEREAKAAQAQVEELTSFRTEVLAERRTADLDRVFSEVGLSPKHAALFAKVNPDAEVTADAVKSFAAEYELTAATGDPIDAPELQAEGLSPIVRGNGSGAPAQGGKMSSREWIALQATDFAKAQALWEKGLVDMSDAQRSGTGLYHDNEG
jgi:hypothetical protein